VANEPWLTLSLTHRSFNDISSITSVLKNYFRALPDPLLTHELHEAFISAARESCFATFGQLEHRLIPLHAVQRDASAKRDALCALLRKLPPAHFQTLKFLMLHLNR
jgi:hypothetical protein